MTTSFPIQVKGSVQGTSLQRIVELGRIQNFKVSKVHKLKIIDIGMKDIVLCINDEFSISIDIEYIAKFYMTVGVPLVDASGKQLKSIYYDTKFIRVKETGIYHNSAKMLLDQRFLLEIDRQDELISDNLEKGVLDVFDIG